MLKTFMSHFSVCRLAHICPLDNAQKPIRSSHTWECRGLCMRSVDRFAVDIFAAAVLKLLLSENELVLKLMNSEILQTEIRVLYELLYILKNSFRGNKTFKGLQQVRTDA